MARELNECTAKFDYRCLNDMLPQPTDENLARHIRAHLKVPGVLAVGVQSTLDAGVDLDTNERAHVWRRYQFRSAHKLPNVPAGHKCGRLHGHEFEVVIHAELDLDDADLSIDYDALDRLWSPIGAILDHRLLNGIPGLENPTSEMVALWTWRRLKPLLPALSWVTVYETASCGAQYDGVNFRIWKEMTIDSATRLKSAPKTDLRSEVHGHTYTLRLHLSAPLDAVLGWTIDYGDVKEMFAPIMRKLDHNPVHEISGIEDGGSHSIALYIKQQCGAQIPALNRVDVYEKRGIGSVLYWSSLGPSLPF